MVNARRGEVEAVIDGRRRVLVLTLGALAQMEAAFGATDLTALAERFGTGRLSARDACVVIAAGLSGGGTPAGTDEVAAMAIEGGAVGAVRLVNDLLAATFGAEPQPRP